LELRATAAPERLGYVFLGAGEEPEARMTYGELRLRATSIAARIRETAGPGDRAVLVYPAGLDFVAAFFGCLYADLIAVPVASPTLRRGEPSLAALRAVVAECDPRIVLTTAAVRVSLAESVRDAPDLARLDWVATDALGKDRAG